MAWYLDTSAAAKLVLEEPHTAALRAWSADHDDDLIASDLVRTELLRAVRRIGLDEADRAALVDRAVAVIDAVALVPVDRGILELAGLLDPPRLRTLDAIHVAVARGLGDDLDGMITYDDRMADAARLNAIRVLRPGMDLHGRL